METGAKCLCSIFTISDEVQCVGEDTASPSLPSLDVCLLCEDMFTTIESTVTGKTTL